MSTFAELLRKYLAPQKLPVLELVALLFSGIAIQLINPQVIRFFLDTAQSGGSTQALLAAAGLYIGFALVQQIMSVATVWVSQNVSWSATNQLRSDLAYHCLKLDLSFHKSRTPGELIERIDGDVTQLANFFSEFTIRVFGNAILIIGILVLLFREDARVGISLSAYSLLTFFLLRVIQQLGVPRWAAARQASAEQYGFLEERISGTEDIRSNGAEPYVLNRLYELMRNVLEKLRAAFLVSSLTNHLTNLLFVFGYAIGLALGVYLYTTSQATIGTAYLIIHYIYMLSNPLQSIREQAQDLQRATASIQRIQQLLQIHSKDNVGKGGRRPTEHRFHIADHLQPIASDLPGGPLSVEVEKVCFSYEDDVGKGGRRPTEHRENVLQDISFNLAPGRVLGILGRTGSGKSTLARLLIHLYDPVSGTIRLGGIDTHSLPISRMGTSDVRRKVAMVTQEVQIFQATVRDNLAFFKSSIKDAQIEQALQKLDWIEWLKSLPQGLDTPLMTGGQGISAGEAQLFAFTRVFLKDPGLVILDEASSRLDPATETLLEKALDHLFDGRTGIIIAHRLRTVQRADDILILEGGRVVEYGSRAKLAHDPNSHFYHLLQTGLEEALV